MAASPGFEPRLTESESAVLPLDDEAISKLQRLYITNKSKMQILLLSFLFFLHRYIKQLNNC